jgi:small subunit ribosomal protein S4
MGPAPADIELVSRTKAIPRRKLHLNPKGYEGGPLARYTGPVCRLCRREGMKLFLEGRALHLREVRHRKAQFPPGQHGKDRKPKIVGYGLQLREKQKAKRYYGLLETQFRNNFEKAAASRASPARTCSPCSSAASTTSSTACRLRHQPRHGPPDRPPRPHSGQRQESGHPVITWCGPTTSSRSARKSRNNPAILAARDATAHMPTPNWLEVDRENLKARVLGEPKREDLVQIKLEEQLIVELYSK